MAYGGLFMFQWVDMYQQKTQTWLWIVSAGINTNSSPVFLYHPNFGEDNLKNFDVSSVGYLALFFMRSKTRTVMSIWGQPVLPLK